MVVLFPEKRVHTCTYVRRNILHNIFAVIDQIDNRIRGEKFAICVARGKQNYRIQHRRGGLSYYFKLFFLCVSKGTRIYVSSCNILSFSSFRSIYSMRDR